MKVFWPEKLSYFENRELLGAGQYGLVYRVFNPKLQQTTAIKLIEAVQDTQERIVKRFKREIKSLQKIDSLHVVQLLDYWIEPTFIAFEMEYVPGISLERLIRQFSAIPYSAKENILLEIIHQICQGLEVLHRADLIHRDLKPSNILLNAPHIQPKSSAEQIARALRNLDFVVKIGDLGVVKDLTASVSITRTSDFLGTASYVSPEQAEGKKITPATDLYALGVIWYELLAGKNPFQCETIIKTINAHLFHEAPPIREMNHQVPIDLEHILMLLLQKEPEQRFFSAERLARVLGQKQEKTTEEEFDISLLVSQRQPAGQICPEFDRLFSQFFSRAANSTVLLPRYEDSIHREHFIYHLQQRTDSGEFLFFTFETEPDAGFIHTFSKQLLLQIPADEKQKIANRLAHDTLLHRLYTFYHTDNFYEQCDYARKYFRQVPVPILQYNHIQLIVTTLEELCGRNKVLFLVSGIREALAAQSPFLASVLTLLKNQPLYWVFPMTGSELVEQKEWFRQNNLIPRDFQLESHFPSSPNCTAAKNILARRQEENRMKGSVNFSPGLKRNEQKFLELFALAGADNPVTYINWLLTKHFNKNSEIVISLMRRQILKQTSHFDRGQGFAFTTPAVYRFFRKNKPDSQVKKDLTAIATFWETQEKLRDREKLAGFYFQLGEHARALQLTRELLDFYYATTDFPRREYYLGKVKKLQRTHKIPPRTSIGFEIEDLVNLAHRGAAEEVFLRGQELFAKISAKDPRERERLFVLINSQAVLLNKKDWLKGKQEISDREFEEERTILDFSEALLLLLNNQFDKAAENISATLMELNETGKYWQIPSGSLFLAEIFARQQRWEQSYKYAAIAYQTARVINDFWVMKHCLEIIPDNPFYRANKHTFLNWEQLRQEMFRMAPDLWSQMDWREGILNVIR